MKRPDLKPSSAPESPRTGAVDPAPAASLPLTWSLRQRALGELLLGQHSIDEAELETALVFQRARPGAKLGTVLRDLGYLDSLRFMEALSARLPVVKPFSGD